MISVNQLQSKFQGIKTRNGKNIYSATPTGSTIAIVPGRSLGYGLNQYFQFPDPAGAPSGQVAEAQIVADLNRIEELYNKEHGDVKFDARWRRMYMGKQTMVPFVKPDGTYFGQPLFTYPCHYCGIVLPDSFIEVDHRQPQAHPGVAILKVLHSLGGPYTVGKGKGRKATAVAGIAGAPALAFTPDQRAVVDALPTIPPKGFIAGAFYTSVNLALDPAKLSRYTITPEGETFLTLARLHFGDIDKYCLNSILNLAPACPLCNGSGGKGAKIHARGLVG